MRAWHSPLALGLVLALATAAPAAAQVTHRQAAAAAIHPVATARDMQLWLSRVPLTRQFPPDFRDTLRGQGSAFVIEMSSAPGCVPCGDLWAKLQRFGRAYGWRVAIIDGREALLRSGRLGLPWVGHPVAWVRAAADANRVVPVAIGTDHSFNLARNFYLAAKMLTGVRAQVGVRAMSKFTGIVGAAPAPRTRPPGG